MTEKISRSEQKRLFKLIEDLAKELVTLSNKDLKKFPGDDEVKEAILSCRGLKTGASKRQVKYLAKLLRQYDTEEMYKFLEVKKGSTLKENHIFHLAERWRDILINDAMEIYDDCRRNQIAFEPDWKSTILNDALIELSSLNEEDVRKTVFQYVKTRNVTQYRELFRMLKASLETEQRKKQQDIDS